MFERMKKYEAAEAQFHQVLEIHPENASALNYLGYMLADRGVRLDEAQKMISRALELDPDNGAYLDSLGWVYYRQNRLEEAAQILVRALDKIGQDATVHDHLGDVYSKMGKTKEAIMQWQASLQAFESGSESEMDPGDAAKIGKKLESAKVRLAKETGVAK
jgi:Flp pilus assembly protein TadD